MAKLPITILPEILQSNFVTWIYDTEDNSIEDRMTLPCSSEYFIAYLVIAIHYQICEKQLSVRTQSGFFRA